MLARKKTYIQNCTGAHLKNEEKSAKQKKISQIISRIIFYVLLLAFLGVTGYVLFFAPYLKISQINVSGNIELNSDEIKSLVENRQQGKLLKTIPQNNFLLIRTKSLENFLIGQFKKIKQVTVTKKFPDTLEINLQERKALLILCSGEKCFLIDEGGIAYLEADFNSPELVQNHLIKISDKSAGSVKIGDVVMNQAFIQYVSGLREELQTLGLVVDADYWTPSLVSNEIDLKVTNGQELYFSTQFPLESAVKTLDIVLKKELSKVAQSEIAYIDLRTENKVFYKLNSVPALPVENTDSKNVDKNKK